MSRCSDLTDVPWYKIDYFKPFARSLPCIKILRKPNIEYDLTLKLTKRYLLAKEIHLLIIGVARFTQ